MVLALVIAAAAGLLRGGSLESLAATRFRWIILLIEGLVIQLVFDIWDPPGLTTGHAVAVLIVSNVAVATFLLVNSHLPGVVLIGAGLVLNVVVIGANQAMPVSTRAADVAGLDPPPQAAELKHERLDDDTRLPWLGDVIPLPGLKEVLSVGDVVLALGIARLVYARTTAERRRAMASEVSG